MVYGQITAMSEPKIQLFLACSRNNTIIDITVLKLDTHMRRGVIGLILAISTLIDGRYLST